MSTGFQKFDYFLGEAPRDVQQPRSWRGNMLGTGSGSFDPETVVILETAFDEAWITLKTNGSGNIRPGELARRICHLAMEGERDPVRLQDRALGELIPTTMWRELS